MLSIIIYIVFFFIIIMMSYVIWNLYKKFRILESFVLFYRRIFNDINERIKYSDLKLKEIDSSGHFEADDEVGFFFKQIKEIQLMLNEFKKRYFE